MTGSERQSATSTPGNLQLEFPDLCSAFCSPGKGSFPAQDPDYSFSADLKTSPANFGFSFNRLMLYAYHSLP